MIRFFKKKWMNFPNFLAFVAIILNFIQYFWPPEIVMKDQYYPEIQIDIKRHSDRQIIIDIKNISEYSVENIVAEITIHIDDNYRIYDWVGDKQIIEEDKNLQEKRIILKQSFLSPRDSIWLVVDSNDIDKTIMVFENISKVTDIYPAVKVTGSNLNKIYQATNYELIQPPHN